MRKPYRRRRSDPDPAREAPMPVARPIRWLLTLLALVAAPAGLSGAGRSGSADTGEPAGEASAQVVFRHFI
ncbi:hypothetical protein [Methylobacterium sp. Leaf87]|uniref:hypothetical protein n=1 Tax=Methylobacterium sp. Leaf87 TaxID=1736243 RepID=UPI0012E6F805|nr:hypothetical protein [Methylobacterium sp. Leaf87]